jgi:Abortive infection C-terminus/HEPN domain
MAGMTSAEITKLVERYLGTDMGYLKGFNYSSHESFYANYCGLDIDVASAREKFGGTTKKAFVGLLREASTQDQAKIIRGTFEFISPPDPSDEEFDQRKFEVYKQLLEVAIRLEAGGSIQVTAVFACKDTVYEALKDAELLMSQRGPEFAVDRAHTALHGYIKSLCQERGHNVSSTASITELFGVMRKHFPEISGVVAHDEEAKRLFGSLATSLDCLNTIRNRATLAHPNDLLLSAPEAMLFINVSRSVLNYLESKLGL